MKKKRRMQTPSLLMGIELIISYMCVYVKKKTFREREKVREGSTEYVRERERVWGPVANSVEQLS